MLEVFDCSWGKDWVVGEGFFYLWWGWASFVPCLFFRVGYWGVVRFFFCVDGCLRLCVFEAREFSPLFSFLFLSWFCVMVLVAGSWGWVCGGGCLVVFVF